MRQANLTEDTRRVLDSIHVDETGNAGSPAVVFLHGAGASGRMWREHMAAMPGFHCLAPDLPGFGRSHHLSPASRTETADLVAALIETRVPARRAHVVGLSWGGGVAHTLIGRHPDLVDRAVIDGAGVLSWWAGGAILAGVTLVSPFLHTRPVLDLFAGIIGMDEEGRADLRASSRRAFRRAFVEGFRTYASPVEMAAPVPMLLVAGEKETATRPCNAAQADLMSDAVARFVPGLGHGWVARATDLHVRMVQAWLAGDDLPAELRPEPPSPSTVARLRRELEKEAPDGDHRLAARPRA